MNGNIWLQLLYKGVIVQTIITILVIASLCFMWTTGKAVPPEMLAIAYVLLGFWGGSTGAIVAYHNGNQITTTTAAAPSSTPSADDV